MMNSLVPFNNLLDSFFAPTCYVPADADENVRSVPRTDILEGEKDYLIRMDLPGVRREDLEIELENGSLTVKAVRAIPEQAGYTALRAELPRKVSYRRTFSVGNGVDTDNIGAKLDEGVLTMTLPKATTALPKRIDIK